MTASSGKKKRRLRKLFLGGLVVAVVTLPWWQQTILWLGARIAGASYERYESVEGGRFRLVDVAWSQPGGGVSFTAGEVEAADLPRWLWSRDARAQVRGWKVEIQDDKPKSADAGSPPPNPDEALALAAQIAGWLERGLGRLDASDGRVLVAGQEMDLPQLGYAQRTLTARVGWRDEEAELSVVLPAAADASADVSSSPSSALSFTAASSARADVKGSLAAGGRVDAVAHWQGNEAGLEATLADSWLPRTLTARGAGWRLPAALWDRTDTYGDLAGDWSLSWENGNYRARVEARAQPLPDRGAGAPPVHAVAEASGDRETITIRRLEVTAPQGRAHLLEPFAISTTGKLLTERSQFDFEVDLGALAVSGLAGRASGRASFNPADAMGAAGAGALAVAFTLDGRGLAWQGKAIGDADIRGEVRWPEVAIAAATLALPEAGGEIKLSGGYNVETRILADTRLEVSLKNAAALAPWLPAEAGDAVFENLILEGHARGPLAAPEHEGKLTVESAEWVRPAASASAPAPKPLSFRVAWSGEGAAVDFSQLSAATADNAAAIELAGRFRPATSPDGEMEVTLSSLRWLRGGEPFAELLAPVTVRQGGETLLEISPMTLGSGGFPAAALPDGKSPSADSREVLSTPDDSRQRLESRRSGASLPSSSFFLSAEASLKTPAADGARRLKFEIRSVTAALLTDWVRQVPAAVTTSGFALSSLAADLSWTSPDAPIAGTLRGAFSADTPLPGERVSVTVDLATGAGDAGSGGIELRTAQIRARDAVLAEASGRFPATLHARREGWFRLSEEVPFAFEIASRDGAGWQETLAELTGVKLSGATLHGRVEGTVGEPRGSLTLAATQLEIPAGRLPFTLPAVTDARVELVFDGREGLRMPVARVDIDGQPVSVSGKLPVRADEWASLPETWSGLVRERAEGELHITKAKVASLARYMPTYLAPAGEVSTDIRYGPRQRLEGTLVLEGAASRPLGPLGVLQQIEAHLRFHERTVEVESLKALAGGQPVTLAGKADWPRGGRPRVDVTLRGQNVPFVRQAGLVVRGDLDLAARSLDDDSGGGRISGEVRLRESMFLADLTSLLPGGTRGASRRPPYFSVEEPPFRDWEIDVSLRGQRFLRVRTPVFAGLVSARFNLAGTLGNPRAVGEATVEDGRVIFPFTTFVVQEGGGIRLTEASPYEPRLQLTGTAQRYDYDLRMELGGTATDPTVQFFSSPALDSEQVLMLVMAGMAPTESSFSASSSRLARFGTYVGADVLRQLGVDDGTSERLTIRSGEKLSRQGKETYAVEYALGGRWAVVGEYDEFDGYNAGVKWRFTPKRAELPEPPEKAEADNEKTDTPGGAGKGGAP
ncbi:hypothetical protein OpiT1DRAFT_00717 [Opitutaceae bacterium TAV1]|nr:hypothetical protein OpiT1DRAFT_00717 [Opitutaceae bacterium TAV1]